jgi:hypothetical protein
MVRSSCNSKQYGESEESMKTFPRLLAVTLLLAGNGYVFARHVMHPVNPKNIDDQPFAFKVQGKTVGATDEPKLNKAAPTKDEAGLLEFEIIVRQKAGKPAPARSATGSVVIDASGKKKAVFPTVTRIQSDGVETYTFRLSPSDLGTAHFSFTETPQDLRIPFPSPGDYWVFDLSEFAGSPKK